MPRSSSKLETRYKLVDRTTHSVRLLLNISGSLSQESAYLKGIAGISLSLLETVEAVKSNKTECLHLVEQIELIILAIVRVCGDAKALSPAILCHLSQFFDTLQKVHAFVRSQLNLGLFRRVLKHGEISALLIDCKAGLQQAVEVFGIRMASGALGGAINDNYDHAQIRHKELLELINTNISTSSFSLYQSSISSLSLLPASPKIFYGRDLEVQQLVKNLVAVEPFRAAILGPGGIGKSSLTLAVLHHEDVIAQFGTRRYFISLESSTSVADMLTAIATFFGIDPGPKLSKVIIRYVSDLAAPCVLVLDNLEDCWENDTCRAEVEDFMSFLSEIPHLRLLVTLRGAERPGKVKWTRPFLAPLEPVDDQAARQIFLDIVDSIETDELTALLALTDHLPLAITLMAHVASFEGGPSVLARWESETTSVLSEGFGKAANLEKSIMISLSSPRMLSHPEARDLLSLLSLLPDGIAEAKLVQMRLPFSAHISRAKLTLLRCSLIYVAGDNRLRTLAPIRQFVCEKFPPAKEHFDGLCSYLYQVASLFRNPTDLPNRELVQRLSSEFTNIRAVAAYALSASLNLGDTVRCMIDLLHFNATARLGSFGFSDAVEQAVRVLGNPTLRADYLMAQARVSIGEPSCPVAVSEALRCYEESGDELGQVRALYTLASHANVTGQFGTAMEKASRGACLAQRVRNPSLQSLCLTALSKAHRSKGDLHNALIHGREARRLSQASGNMTSEAWVTQQYASCCVAVGDYTRSADLCADVISLLSALGLAHTDVHAYKNVLNVSAEILARRTEYAAARALRMRIYAARRATDDLSRAWDLLNIAQIDVDLRDFEGARRNIDIARSVVSAAVWKAAGLDLQAGLVEADLDCLDGDFGAAKQKLLHTLAESEWVDLKIIALEKLSTIHVKTGDVASAMRHSVLLLAAAKSANDLAATIQALRRLGDISLDEGDEGTAMNLFQVALDGFTAMGIHRGAGECLSSMGDVWMARGEALKAADLWTQARPLFDKSSQYQEVAKCNERLVPLTALVN